MDGSKGGYGEERPGKDAERLRPGGAFLAADGHARPLAEVERDAIRFALRLYDGNLSETARRLGIGRSTLYRRLTELRED